jgi:hypothetical protein
MRSRAAVGIAAHSKEAYMAKQDTFTADEWTTLRLAPSLIAGGVAASDPSGLFASIKEAAAGARGMAEAYQSGGNLELFAALAADHSMPGMPDPRAMMGEGTREQQMQNFKTAVLERVKSASDLVARKGSPEEASAYRKMLVDVAQKSAEASSEGGFLGFGGVRVSDKEKAFLTEVGKAAGVA